MRFCTAINCLDGRVQLPVIQFLQKRYIVNYVDTITEPAPNLILSSKNNTPRIKSIIEKVNISISAHDSKGIAVIGHHGCAGNPASNDIQIAQIRKAVNYLQNRFHNLPVIGLWVDENFNVHELNGINEEETTCR